MKKNKENLMETDDETDHSDGEDDDSSSNETDQYMAS